jgi:wyosine [tRNA(Phe)-imidazoG37] synthetase (radical SAM superfamily)
MLILFTNMSYKYIFGPVLSRRLGLSLGVDVIPKKTCNLNCVYCESGRTSLASAHRASFIPVKDIIAELKDFLKTNPKIDHITFSGAGEPTLYQDLPEIILFIKENYPQYKLAMITNSILLAQPEIRQELLSFDVILPSLDAISTAVFNKINRPVNKIEYQKVINGLISFSKDFKGKIWLEVFIIEGINDTESELALLKEYINKIAPDVVQLNTLDRPGTESWVKPASWQKLEEIKKYFTPLKVEIVARNKTSKHYEASVQNIDEQIINTIKRRPCTAQELTTIIGLESDSIEIHIQLLISSGTIEPYNQSGIVFYKIRY